ncbi:hypothetical protein BpHYR1_002595 [Brachionus plicatilis]|uniref:Uncharacterized protein n=1 Tax=Brachionus plicatilis TaxID=10195 RepID=A0A3M7RMH4_BRAPC|nr:hypothetical protein BpHYR1_002595 [Brachionus plicatilis]
MPSVSLKDSIKGLLECHGAFHTECPIWQCLHPSLPCPAQPLQLTESPQHDVDVFDRVCHASLKAKLVACRLCQSIVDWISDFLSRRQQRVVMGQHITAQAFVDAENDLGVTFSHQVSQCGWWSRFIYSVLAFWYMPFCCSLIKLSQAMWTFNVIWICASRRWCKACNVTSFFFYFTSQFCIANCCYKLLMLRFFLSHKSLCFSSLNSLFGHVKHFSFFLSSASILMHLDSVSCKTSTTIPTWN